MQGHRVAPLVEAVADAEVVVTATGGTEVVRAEYLERLPDNVLLANSEYFDVEIDLEALAAAADRTTTPRPGVARYHTPDGRRINLLSKGRLVNLTGPKSEGHSAEVMDVSFAMMTRAAVALVERDLSPGVHGVPTAVDREVAERKLAALGLDTTNPPTPRSRT